MEHIQRYICVCIENDAYISDNDIGGYSLSVLSAERTQFKFN